MDEAATTFVDELVNCSGKNFVNDIIVKDKICRFAFDSMLKCLMGDSSDIQTSSKNEDILQRFNDLNDAMSDYYRHPIRMIFVSILPFNLGRWLGTFFIDSINNERIATRKRDIYIDKMIARVFIDLTRCLAK